jgi:hypothetical protein
MIDPKWTNEEVTEDGWYFYAVWNGRKWCMVTPRFLTTLDFLGTDERRSGEPIELPQAKEATND